MTIHQLPDWQKVFTGQDRHIYLLAQAPDWLVAPSTAAAIIDQLLAGKPAWDMASNRLQAQLQRPEPPPYEGRASHLRLRSLKECWFHLTNNCNLACGHCLFASSPGRRPRLDPHLLRQALAEARGLGCRLFYFTGGEPFVYADFMPVITEILNQGENHVVVLSNGLLLHRHLDALTRLDPARLHLQISVDGNEENHDAIRGQGSYQRLMTNLDLVHKAGFATTLSMAVCRQNCDDMTDLVRLAAEQGCANVHFLWHFQRGKGTAAQHVTGKEILPRLLAAQAEAEKLGLTIDNMETLRAQVFATPGTRFDLSNAAWESLAVGPDSQIYPSPALVGVAELACGPLGEGLETIWRQSPVLDRLRRATLINTSYEENPWRFLVGGGDIDHSYLAGGSFSGHDPYVELYNGVAQWLIERQAAQYPACGNELLLKMGDVRCDCPDGQAVTMTHCNCVVALPDGRSSVRKFYGRAARAANEDIVNPFARAQAEADFIPTVSRQRSYGCGSPVTDAEPAPGETLVDLGSGSGVECFMAAEKVGAAGRVIGIDMTAEMLDLARSSQAEVARRLGYDNVEFRHGFLEEIPLESASVDAVISNCVINLSTDKRRVFLEVMRLLRPGGRLVVSDIVTDTHIPAAMKNDEQFRGECLGGAMQQEELLTMLRATGFTAVELVKRFPYRLEGGVQFYSLTFRAWKPATTREIEVIYRGPHAAITTAEGDILFKGRRQRISTSAAQAFGHELFIVDTEGAVTNMSMEACCCPLPEKQDDKTNQPCDCARPPEEQEHGPGTKEQRLRQDCMVCGAPLVYHTDSREEACHYCGRQCWANARCSQGHFVCDQCHQAEGLALIRQCCIQTEKQDMVALLQEIRSHSAINMHGPEHHALLPGIILAVARNSGMPITDEDILTGIERGSKVPGGACGFMGSCGAATGVGIAMAVLFESTPITPFARQQAQSATARVLSRLAELKAGRCCQRECWLALREVARLSTTILPVLLKAEASLRCNQYQQNRECVRRHCPLWEGRDQQTAPPLTVFPIADN